MPEFRNPRYVRVDPRNGGVDPVGPLTRAVEPFAWAIFMILIGGAVWWLFKQIAFAVGALAIGYVVGRLLVKVLFRKVRRAVSTALEPVRPRQPVEWQQSAAVAPSQQQPLSQGDQHLHIYLPAGTDAGEVARIIRGGGA